MIRRDTAAGPLLIDQHDHALAAAALARCVGNGLFAPPSPFESVVAAIANHDAGWPPHDARPKQNPHGLPAHVFEIDLQTAIAAWSASVDHARSIDVYAALLVSLHAMALANRAALREPAAGDEASRHRLFSCQRFLHRQIELQEALRSDLQMRIDLPLRCGLADAGRSPEEDLLRSNFYLLEFLDQLSLVLCFDRLVFEKIAPVYPRPASHAMTLRLNRDPDGTIRINPWPFNVQSINLQIPAWLISPPPYRDDAQFQTACATARIQTLPLRLRPPLSPSPGDRLAGKPVG